ncbi:MAG: hypothetical protein Q8R85_10270 [Bosea sp. (in: a-proteobacteria)]|uniref:hypothetical protein n=1 Tax=Bosea sp. (in: a-proteobacteria) TaxID=1871050 RepID=UPI0027373829|nr:hypothetical protein [Bosea sp. (in: a-proteobacteria)]MDP3601538.1 hypothetical protein [Bosea sp. (in: a-proteobacteria)]
MTRHFLSIACGLLAAGCATSPQPDLAGGTGGRELRPARAGINVGSLYFARERATEDRSRPVNLERLCEVSLERYAVLPVDARQSDVDLSFKLEASGAASGIKNIFVSLGLSGNFSDHFEYKLTNVIDRSISYQEAQTLFDDRAFKRDCSHWRKNISRENWARYQILSIKTGDIVLRQKTETGVSADIKAKIAVAEPQLKVALSRSYNLAVSGQGMVIAVNPIIRE